MKSTLKYLVQLQEIDRQLFEIEEKKGSLPEKVEKLESQAAEVKTALEETRTTLEQNQEELTAIQGKMMDSTEQVKKYQDQLYLVTTNREYDALTNQIETVKSDLAEMEGRRRFLESEITSLKEIVSSSQEKSASYDEQLEANRDELKEKSDLTDARQQELEAQRLEVISHISQRYLRKYERILKARRRAVVPIERHACSGCHKQLSPQIIYEIQQMDSLIECENCGRILVYKAEDED